MRDPEPVKTPHTDKAIAFAQALGNLIATKMLATQLSPSIEKGHSESLKPRKEDSARKE